MGPPFIAYYGAIKKDQEMLQLAYDNCRLYRDALLVDGPTGKLWAHIYDDGKKQWVDKGIWGTGKIFNESPNTSADNRCFRSRLGIFRNVEGSGNHSPIYVLFSDEQTIGRSEHMDKGNIRWWIRCSCESLYVDNK